MAFLVRDKKVVSCIVYDLSGDACAKHAVSEYCLFFKQCVTVDQPLFASIPSGYETLVFVDPKPELIEEKYGIKIPYNSFEPDTVYIKVKDNVIILSGGERGKLYSVYEFLERFFGCRFYSPTMLKTPRHETIEVKDCEIIYTPKIKFRDAYNKDSRFDKLFSARIRNTSENYGLSKANFGGGLKWALPTCHTTFKNLLPPEDEEYGFAKHPEFYSYRKDLGRRVGRHHNEFGFPYGEGEVCWSNKEAIKVIFKRLQQWILENPDKEIFSVTQNDWPNPCECEECLAAKAKYGDTWSAPIILAVNELARMVRKWQEEDERVKNRHILIETFAYSYATNPPEGLKVEDNVLIRLCTHECCFYHAYDDTSCPVNAHFMKIFKKWRSVAKNVFIWDYTNNSCMDVTFNTIFFNLQRNVQLFADSGIVGMFSEFEDGLDYHGGFYPEIREYFYARLLWNPYIDLEKEMEEAFEFYYGRSGKYILQIEKEFRKNCDTLKDFHPRFAYMLLKEHYSDEFLAKADELFKKALEESENIDYEIRIKKDYVCFKFVRMYFRRETSKQEMDEVVKEFDYLKMNFSKYKLFIDHYYHGKSDDLFLESIEIRNKERARKKIEALMG